MLYNTKMRPLPPHSLDISVYLQGFPFGENKPDFQTGSLSSGMQMSGFFYGDTGGHSGFNGGGVFDSKTGLLMGIARSNQQGKETADYGDVLEIFSVLSEFYKLSLSDFRLI